MIHIDGSYGEGGGQILRTSLTLSSILNLSFEMNNIRAKRKKPGLLPQHLTSVRAAKKITDAKVEGDEFKSQNLVYEPKKICGGEYEFDVAEERGSAGATGLVFQTIIPILLFGKRPSKVTIKGGTHVPFAPPYHYLKETFLPTLRKMDLELELSIGRWGFYPRGGGEISVLITPLSNLNPLRIAEKGKLLELRGISAVANLPLSIAHRQKKRTVERLNEFKVDIEIEEAASVGPGTFIFLLAKYENCLCGFSALGARGKPAERVADEVADAFLYHHNSNGAVEKHLADQLLLYASLAKGESSFTTSKISQHLFTNKWVVEKFLPAKIEIDGSSVSVKEKTTHTGRMTD